MVAEFNYASGTDAAVLLCWVDRNGRYRPVKELARGGAAHAEKSELGHCFALLTPAGAPEEGRAVAWFRPTRELQGARYTVTLLQQDGTWRITAAASRSWMERRQNPEYRVVVRPTSCSPNTDCDPRLRGARLPPAAEDWILKYRYDVPPYPTAGWIPTEHTFFIWGDVDFDMYNSGRQWGTVAPQYRFNQIVPQLMTGWCLADNDSNCHTKHKIYDHWVIQAQYYWQRAAGAANRSRALCGPAVQVEVGDIITTEIEYKAAIGAIRYAICVDTAVLLYQTLSRILSYVKQKLRGSAVM
eukprot:SAG31_NODE_429_length_15801_cov_6.878551_6_plen_299_part_00